MNFIQSIIPVFYLAVSIAFVVAACMGIRYFVSATRQKGIQISAEAMDLIEKKVIYAFKYVNQTLVSTYKQKNPDGKLTDEQAQEVKIVAKNLIMNLIDMAELEAVLSNMSGSSEDESNSLESILNIKDMTAEEYIDMLIEAVVSDYKTSFNKEIVLPLPEVEA